VKIGVKIGPATERSVKRVAHEAEKVGFDSIWLSERVAVPLEKPHPYQPSVDPWIGLSFVAAVTERVTIGTSVSQIALRPPVLMARELATLDRLSEGRLIVGAGAGWVEEEFESTGVPFETRGGRLNEFIRQAVPARARCAPVRDPKAPAPRMTTFMALPSSWLASRCMCASWLTPIPPTAFWPPGDQQCQSLR